MIYTNEEIQAMFDLAYFALMDCEWMKLRNEVWLENLIELCHTGK